MNTKRVTIEQLEMLLDMMTENPELATNKLSGPMGKQQAQKGWKQVALRLNSLGNGPAKNSVKWSKTWSDWKFNIKKKFYNLRAEALRTDEAIPSLPPLTPIEERLLALIGCEGAAALDVKTNDYNNGISNEHNAPIELVIIDNMVASPKEEAIDQPNSCFSERSVSPAGSLLLHQKRQNKFKNKPKKSMMRRILDLEIERQELEQKQLDHNDAMLAFEKNKFKEEMNFLKSQEEQRFVIITSGLHLLEKFLMK